MKGVEGYYFLKRDDTIYGPYSVSQLLNIARDKRAKLETPCSADKVNWKTLRQVFWDNGISLPELEKIFGKVQKLTPIATGTSPKLSRPSGRTDTTGRVGDNVTEMKKSVWRDFIEPVFGLLWNPERVFEQLLDQTPATTWMVLGYTAVMCAAASMFRGYHVAQDGERWWMYLLFGLGLTAFMFCVILFLNWLFGVIIDRKEEANSDFLLLVVADCMVCGTFAAEMVFLIPAGEYSIAWVEGLVLPLLVVSYTYFCATSAIFRREFFTMRFSPRRARAAGLISTIILSLITILAYFFTKLFKE